MRIRKCLALGGAVLIFLGCLIIYRMTDHTLYMQEEYKFMSARDGLGLRAAGRRRGGDRVFVEDEDTKASMKLTGGNEANARYNEDGGRVFNIKNREVVLKTKASCKRINYYSTVDLEMSELYKDIPFDNIDGGVWKQGWNIETDPSKWTSKNKLKVFVVPHSHNDPGWLKTFEDYYLTETRLILNSMLKKLTSDPRKKFIWAEISFFSTWWDELSEDDQQRVRGLVESGQLEFVTGGWVMNDEANTHYYSMITQLTEGHQWMKANVGVEPKSGWTIDPFGESPVMPYLLKKMGLENLAIQRVHYSVKKHLARSKNLEFRWRQFWDETGLDDMFTHMMPFYSYDIPHTCGPDPKICCQFDFKRLPGTGLSCPWKEPPKPITKKNVVLRAQMLLDQYQKKAELYRTNVLLVPLGDDFRYQLSSEWDYQFDNYYKLMDYINESPNLHAEVKFGTLSEYFDALRTASPPETFPTLVGDFFTYADRDDHYWSGYYTSRPFYKRLDRLLIGYHRAAEIIFSLGWGLRGRDNAAWLLAPHHGFAKMLRDARRSLSLFQHHDGVTGTARDNVMEDYGQKMMAALGGAKFVVERVSHFLLSPTTLPYPYNPDDVHFEFDDTRRLLSDSPGSKVFAIPEGDARTVVLYNSLGHTRREMVSVVVSSPHVEVHDHEDNVVPCQTSPFFSQDDVIDDNQFEVSFVAKVPALGLATYKLVRDPSNQPIQNTLSRVKVFNAVRPMKPWSVFDNVEVSEGREFSVENARMAVTVSDRGLLKSVTNKETMEFIPLHLDFYRYTPRETRETSGAYLFLPDDDVVPVSEKSPLVRIVEGPLFTRVEVVLQTVRHFLQVYNVPELEHLGLEITNVVDILSESNYELSMRLSSQVKSGDAFYTDLNGFQVIKRTRLKKLPVQGNFYPMPTAAFIEDERTRVTVLSGQPLGVSSLAEGELEVMQDRRLKQDDNRGLGQGVLDNRVTPNVFRVLVERRLDNCNSDSALLSARAYKSSQSLLNPVLKMMAASHVANALQTTFSPVSTELPWDVHLVGARTFNEESNPPSVGLVFHRSHLDVCFYGSPTVGPGTINVQSLLPNHFGNDVKRMSLSFLKEESATSRSEDQKLCHWDFLPLMLS